MVASSSSLVSNFLILLLVLACRVDGAVHTISTLDLTWSPANITITVGDSIQFTGLGGGSHIPVAMISGFDCGSANEDRTLWIPPSGGTTFTAGPFNAAMSFPYKCLPHCQFGMVGVITVVSSSGSTPISTPTTVATTTTKQTTTLSVSPVFSPTTVNITAITTDAGFRWSPSDVLIHVGDSIRFTNLGDGFHQAVATKTSGQCDQSAEQPGVFSCLSGNECVVGPFTTAETIHFKCIPHCASGMVGSITVESGVVEVKAVSTSSGFRWSPDAVTILPGDVVHITGLEGGFHQAVALSLSSPDCSQGSERPDIFACLSGDECTVGPFTTTGDIPYKCIPHCSSGMVGLISVVPEGSQLNTTRVPISTGGGDDSYYWVTVHGGLMGAAWMGLVPLSIAIARYAKPIGAWWFRLHATLGIMVVAVTTAGFIVIEVKYPVDYDDHVILGLIVFIGMYLQVILGGVIDQLYKSDRKSAPWHDIVHWIFGLILLVIAWVATPLGFHYYADDRYGDEDSVKGSFIAYGVAAFFILVCFAVLEIRQRFLTAKE